MSETRANARARILAEAVARAAHISAANLALHEYAANEAAEDAKFILNPRW
jgi:hypothetical protein